MERQTIAEIIEQGKRDAADGNAGDGFLGIAYYLIGRFDIPYADAAAIAQAALDAAAQGTPQGRGEAEQFALQQILDIAQTGLPPAALGMTQAQYDSHRLDRIAFLSREYLKAAQALDAAAEEAAKDNRPTTQSSIGPGGGADLGAHWAKRMELE